MSSSLDMCDMVLRFVDARVQATVCPSVSVHVGASPVWRMEGVFMHVLVHACLHSGADQRLLPYECTKD